MLWFRRHLPLPFSQRIWSQRSISCACYSVIQQSMRWALGTLGDAALRQCCSLSAAILGPDGSVSVQPLAGSGKSRPFGQILGHNRRRVTRCGGRPMRGWDAKSDALFSYVSCEARVPKDHPLRPIRRMVDEALVALSPEFEQLYAKFGRPSIPPERLLRALLLQAFYSVRSE